MDRFSYDGSEPQVVATCAHCREDIRDGDDVRQTCDNVFVHEDCAVNFALEYTFHKRGVIDEYGTI